VFSGTNVALFMWIFYPVVPLSTVNISSFIDTNLIHNFLYKLHKIKFLYMFPTTRYIRPNRHLINNSQNLPVSP
jgi:hypothetical protein